MSLNVWTRINEYFGRYMEYLSRLPSITRREVGHETVVSHLGRIKRVFVECYQEFITGSGKTVVIVLDTVEAIRGLTCSRRSRSGLSPLPGTLVYPERPSGPRADRDGRPPSSMSYWTLISRCRYATVDLGDFAEQDAARYLNEERIGVRLTDAEIARMVLLTRGHQLWLAFTVGYMREVGLPALRRRRATGAGGGRAGPPPAGHALRAGDASRRARTCTDAFKRNLVAPFQDSDFWHEAVKPAGQSCGRAWTRGSGNG